MLEVPLFVSAFVAGMLMFLAPCTLPIVPAYLAFIAGVPLSDLRNPAKRDKARWAVFRNACAFVVGFSAVFILLGASAGLLGVFIGPWRFILFRIGGAVLVVFGLTMLGWLPLEFLSRERHVRLPAFLRLGTLPSSALIGALFAFGWSPCIGPILGTVLLLASSGSTAWWGALLLAVFSAGLAVPFLLVALMVTKAGELLARLDILVRVLTLFGGVSLIVMGFLVMTGSIDWFVAQGYALFNALGYDALLNYL